MAMEAVYFLEKDSPVLGCILSGEAHSTPETFDPAGQRPQEGPQGPEVSNIMGYLGLLHIRNRHDGFG